MFNMSSKADATKHPPRSNRPEPIEEARWLNVSITTNSPLFPEPAARDVCAGFNRSGWGDWFQLTSAERDLGAYDGQIRSWRLYRRGEAARAADG